MKNSYPWFIVENLYGEADIEMTLTVWGCGLVQILVAAWSFPW